MVTSEHSNGPGTDVARRIQEGGAGDRHCSTRVSQSTYSDGCGRVPQMDRDARMPDMVAASTHPPLMPLSVQSPAR